ncbi:hypothetical protein BCV72DRAFT_227680 [Rhizopus microsporus var. microsporus]|uniref:F-box domain-containing protein n=2 Tax=Rhizopus microsporus TaxID=58291 RepID=A0A2G4SJ28_RHIZD|nr:uncharacterized protein RHIMIDRAFT_267686 [Rhizopus microsporus ATCC 52813]ORE06852.1 hypothetical protein BCV72DRAFT_227680 [Rhizopus microsporus var. microsporus]PHZ08759.1 hypothetical protein RHIMIDRAFT_267686 [Rhizopus microsporus ATCC 52813]
MTYLLILFLMNLQPVRKRQKRSAEPTQKEKRIDFVISSFSKELALKVFSYLSSADLLQCAAVSTHWAKLANDETLWKPLFYNRFCESETNDQNHIARSNNKRRTSATRYGGSWKTKYRVHQNWLHGNCYVNDITIGNDTESYPNSQQLFQMTKDIMFVVSADKCKIDVWKYIKDESRLLCRIESARLANSKITFIRLIDGNPLHLLGGYANGGFVLWEIKANLGSLSINEITNHNPQTDKDDSVISIGMDFPIVLLCTKNMKLSAFYIDETNTVRPIHRLQSPVDWSSVHIDIHKQTHNQPLWVATICFSLAIGNHATSVGLQEVILSSTTIVSSRHASALESEPFFFSSSMSYYLQQNTNDSNDSSLVTAMAYSPPYLITAHPNNTIKKYIITKNRGLDIRFEKILYGHTFRVEALALQKEKLVSADRSGIKIWNLLKDDTAVTIYTNKNQSFLQDLPALRIRTLCFDEDRIAAFAKDDKDSFVRLWSFDSRQK